MMTRLRCAALALSMTALLGGSAQATLLWYDGFTTTDAGGDYVVNTRIEGQLGGSGSFFAGPWVDAAADPVEAALVHPTSISRPGLISPPVGGSTGKEVLFDCCVFTRNSRLMASPWGGFTDPDGTFYTSFLMNFGTGNAADPHHRVFEMHDGGFDDNLNRNLMFGISNFAGLGNQLALNVEDATTSTATNVVLSEAADLADLSVQGTHLIVLKFEMSTTGNDVISAFLDPVGTTEPTASAVVSVGQFLADRMSSLVQFTFNSGGASAAGVFDEIRVGTEFSDVANNTVPFGGVPEPTSLGLLGLGAIGMLLSGRRK